MNNLENFKSIQNQIQEAIQMTKPTWDFDGWDLEYLLNLFNKNYSDPDAVVTEAVETFLNFDPQETPWGHNISSFPYYGIDEIAWKRVTGLYVRIDIVEGNDKTTTLYLRNIENTNNYYKFDQYEKKEFIGPGIQILFKDVNDRVINNVEYVIKGGEW